jgi:hypothetical protein
MSDVPTVEPKRIVAGDSTQWKITLSDYPASDGWKLSYVLFKTGSQITFDSTAEGDDHLVSLSAATTAQWSAGEYNWSAYVTKDGQRETVRGEGGKTAQPGSGYIKILPDFSQQTSGYDGRSNTKVMLDAVRAQLQGRATKEQAQMVVGGNVIDKTPIDQLRKLYDELLTKWQQEQAQADQAAGLGNTSNILVRFEDA